MSIRVDSMQLIPAGDAPLSKDQKVFNNLIASIAARRALLADWEQAIPLFQEKYLRQLLPLREKERALHIALAQKLDWVHAQKGVTISEREKLSAMIVNLAEHVLWQVKNEEMRILHNRHGGVESGVEEEEVPDEMESALESAPEADAEVDYSHWDDRDAAQAKAAAHKQFARAKAMEARSEAENQRMSQSIRDVYRKLASALHPDRERDPVEQLRKTELMQRVNVAYAKGHLLQLLELQLELEHIDQAYLANLDKQRLKHFIKILKGQLADLDTEIERVEREFAAAYGLASLQGQHPQKLAPILKASKAACEANIGNLNAILATIGDLKQLKVWLKMIS